MPESPTSHTKRGVKTAKLSPKAEKRETSSKSGSYMKSGSSANEEQENLNSQTQFKGKAHSVADTTASFSTYRADPTREKISLCVAGYQLTMDWIDCVAKFDTGSDADWISEKLASRIGLQPRETTAYQCKNFDGRIFVSDRITDKMTWAHSNKGKTICGSFRISENLPYDIIIGKHTLFYENILSTGDKIHGAGVLMMKKISKEEAEQSRAESVRQRERSEALLKKQAERQKKEEADILTRKQNLLKRDGQNNPGGTTSNGRN